MVIGDGRNEKKLSPHLTQPTLPNISSQTESPNPQIEISTLHKIRLSVNFEALKLWHAQSGTAVEAAVSYE